MQLVIETKHELHSTTLCRLQNFQCKKVPTWITLYHTPPRNFNVLTFCKFRNFNLLFFTFPREYQNPRSWVQNHEKTAVTSERNTIKGNLPEDLPSTQWTTECSKNSLLASANSSKKYNNEYDKRVINNLNENTKKTIITLRRPIYSVIGRVGPYDSPRNRLKSLFQSYYIIKGHAKHLVAMLRCV